jgi:uncharacterized protein with GYD domain
MAAYLYQVAYTPEAWAGLAQSPQDRTEAMKPAVEQLDGTVIAEWLSFGEYDVVSIIDLPDNVSAAALSIAASKSGAIKSIKTTPLMSTVEGIRAMEKAQASVFAPPPAAKTAVHA